MIREARILIDDLLQTRLRAFQTAFSGRILHVVIEARDLEVVHREILLHFSQTRFDSRSQRALWILLQQHFQPLLGFACVRDIAIGKSHLPHLCFRHFQTGIVREWIGREERQPVLVSLCGLNQSAGGAFEEERVGDSEFCEWQKRRIGIGIDDRCEEQAAGVVMALANLFRGFFKQHAVTSGNCGAGQVSVFVFTAAKQTEELSFFLLLVIAGIAGRGGFRRPAVSCKLVSTRVFNSATGASSRSIAVVSNFSALSFFVRMSFTSEFNDADFLFESLQSHDRIVSVGLLVLIGS